MERLLDCESLGLLCVRFPRRTCFATDRPLGVALEKSSEAVGKNQDERFSQ